MKSYKVEYTDSFDKALSNLKKGEQKYIPLIIKTVEICLGRYLMEYVQQCNKKMLKGQKEPIGRLHIRRLYTVLYLLIEDTGKEPYALIYKLEGFEEAHQKYDR